MEGQPLNYGEVAYFGTSAAGSFPGARPLVLIALLIALFGLVLCQGNQTTVGATPQVGTAASVGAQS
jgi:hypothetical protein